MGMQKEPIKASILPYLSSIICEGNVKESPLYKDRKDGTQSFLEFSKKSI